MDLGGEEESICAGRMCQRASIGTTPVRKHSAMRKTSGELDWFTTLEKKKRYLSNKRGGKEFSNKGQKNHLSIEGAVLRFANVLLQSTRPLAKERIRLEKEGGVGGKESTPREKPLEGTDNSPICK